MMITLQRIHVPPPESPPPSLSSCDSRGKKRKHDNDGENDEMKKIRIDF